MELLNNSLLDAHVMCITIEIMRYGAEAEKLTMGQDAYPPLLTEIPDAPQNLFLLGEHRVLNTLCIAIVGTRKASSAGLSLARSLSAKLASRGITIVSGLARGIDAAAHSGTLEARGTTVAVLPCGIGSLYPTEHHDLARRIISAGGAIVSEYPGQEPAFKYRFIDRNRIISGLSIATIVIEAPERSGALATARFAAEQGRTVFVIPGPAAHPNYKGSHALIRDGATLAASAEDVLEDLGLPNLAIPGASTPDLSDEENAVYAALQNAGSALDLDTLARKAGLSPQAASHSITLLLIKERITEGSDGYSAR